MDDKKFAVMVDSRFAVLIDGDNVGYKYIKYIVDEMTNEGILTYKRIYGDWTDPKLKHWKDVLLEYSFTPMQQYSYTKGKNSTDSAMIIDAMDILYQAKVDGFCIVSSDSDFTRLAMRLREAGMEVIGMGKRITPKPFVTACSKFKYLDVISDGLSAQDAQEAPISAKKTAAKSKKRNEKAEAKPLSEPTKAENSQTPDEEVKKAVAKIIEENANEDGWILGSALGNMLQNKYSDFDIRNYGFKRMIDLLNSWGFETLSERDPNNKKSPTATVLYVRIKR